MKRALIIGTEGFLIRAMRFALRQAPGIQALGVLERDGSLAGAIREAHPDLVLLEASDETEQSLARLAEIREEQPSALIVLVAARLDIELFQEAAREGAIACLGALPGGEEQHPLTDGEPRPAGPPRLEVVEPECALTPRELEVLRSVAEGHTNAQIGRELWLTEQTVKFHLSKIYRKLGVSNRTEASRYALLLGMHAPQHSTRHRASSHRIGRLDGRTGYVGGARAVGGALR